VRSLINLAGGAIGYGLYSLEDICRQQLYGLSITDRPAKKIS
jgi:hypothetical protein